MYCPNCKEEEIIEIEEEWCHECNKKSVKCVCDECLKEFLACGHDPVLKGTCDCGTTKLRRDDILNC